MKKGNPEKKNNEREEKNWWEGDIQKSDETSLEENLEMARKTGTRLIVSALVFAVILIALICIAIMQWNLRGEDDTETSGTITVTGNPDMTVRLENTSAETEIEEIRSEVKKIPEETIMEEVSTWQRDIFGTGISQAISGNLELDGMTDGMREAVNFRESDFLTGAAAFLTDQKLSTKRITIEEELPCSSDGAIVYLAELQGINDQALIIMLYPDYPGKFQFLLMTAGAVNKLVETAGKSGEVSQTEEVLEIETTSVVAAPAQAETQAAQTEPPYDATRLSIRGLPGTLDNYINNRYELQYSLYDYLYHNGYREVTAATVSDYTIDGDERTATISFLLSDGRTITGIYSKDSNTYSFY